ncbi:PGF-CTERM sorting domain-containing protein [Halegenticoccus soli]|uniref:PGF-CTERM sorting domain-containing protein n=1 Tax=Halegenticoccus soli TaxID=1985678 RepID=UPI000C6E4FDE|nr:PGF-CTERM sorting domain-containing protein [Halegenticoccus soli]
MWRDQTTADETDATTPNRRISRRRLLRAGAAIPAAGVVARAGRAQEGNGTSGGNETDGGNQTGGNESGGNEGGVGSEDDEVTTTAGLLGAAPKFNNRNYTGLFVKILGDESDVPGDEVKPCPFVGPGEDVVTTEAVLIDRIEAARNSKRTSLYADKEDENIEPGNLFVINEQNRCGTDAFAVTLELIREDVPTTTPTETESGGQGGDETGIQMPGFGVPAALAGIGAAAYAALRGSESE